MDCRQFDAGAQHGERVALRRVNGKIHLTHLGSGFAPYHRAGDVAPISGFPVARKDIEDNRHAGA
ncbi:MAG: hypothetical protein BWX54_01599 [Verrucomicrobia bacterium ADurb.Bin018]|nr:MAG: hypothetical protein BWX54_01599 [Verrucomicrobia bacterium ADurb.Bin018]